MFHLLFARTQRLQAAAVVMLLMTGVGMAQTTLRVAIEVPAQFDPAFAPTPADTTITNAVYDYLVDVNANNDIVPRLAISWEVSEDGLTYTFTLAEGVTFHDGSPLTPEDVVWTFNRLRNPDLALPNVDVYANIADIHAVGDNMVQFVLTETNPFFLYDVAFRGALIVKADTEDFDAFNGTGPFVVVDYSAGNRMSLVANENYFIEGKPGVDALEFIFFSDQVAGVDALRGGQVDIVLFDIPLPLFETLNAQPDIVSVAVPSNAFDMVRLRTDRAPGNDPRVVEALKLAIDRQTIFDVVKNGIGALGIDSPIGPFFGSYHAADLIPPTRDVVRARELLAEAGYADGLTLTLHTPDTGDRPDLAVVLQQQLAEAGFDIEISVEPESVYYGNNDWLEVDLGITGWSPRSTPQSYLDVMIVCNARWNETRYCNEEVDDLVQIAGTTLDEAVRIEAYREIQAILLDTAPMLIPYFYAEVAAHSDAVSGFDLVTPRARTDLAAVTLE